MPYLTLCLISALLAGSGVWLGGVGVSPVELLSCFSCGDCIFKVFKIAEVYLLMVVLDPGFPFGDTLVPAYARVPRCVVTAFTFVLVVLLVRNLSQVKDSVVSSDSVDVVYLVFRPSSVHVKPSKPVGFVEPAMYRNQKVTFAIRAACYVADFYPVRRANFPSENPGFLVVI